MEIKIIKLIVCNYEQELYVRFKEVKCFLDSSKRIVNLITNKKMIKYGQGIISVLVDEIGWDFAKFINYYETNDTDNLKDSIYYNCIDSIN